MVLKMSGDEVSDFIEKADFSKGNGLVPVVVQDDSNDRVLMQAFMNREALRLTLSTGKMHFWSRTRGRIWLKGEESGHHSLLQNAILDCDNDSILFKVQQIGVCCHTGKETCFHKPVMPEKEVSLDGRTIERISEVIKERIENPKPNSYVSQLVAKGENAIIQKIGEEATELVIAAKDGKKDRIVPEMADLLFHALILLSSEKIDLREIFRELRNRHQAKTVPHHLNP